MTEKGPSEWLEGHLTRVVWASAESGWAVVRINTGTEVVTAVGPLAGIGGDADEGGGFVALEGRFEHHPLHGQQFKATGFLPATPRTLEGLKIYLATSGIGGIGPRLAARIVDHFGHETIGVLETDPERLAEVRGVGRSRAAAVAKRWEEDKDHRAMTVALRGLGLSARLIGKIRDRYGNGVMDVVNRQPYRLAEEVSGIGFRTADRLARQVGIGEDDPGRARAAVLHVVKSSDSDGHCFLPRGVVDTRVRGLGVPGELVDAAIDEGLGVGRIAVEPADDAEWTDLGLALPHPADRVWWTPILAAERRVALRLGRMHTAATRAVDAEEVGRAAYLEGVELGEEQHLAVATALGGGVSVITGGPGTGKTTLVRVLLRAARERGEEWLLASPTGRAAKRLEQATGRPAKTLHRLLEYRPDKGGFTKGVDSPLEGVGLVVDEVSMVDIELLDALLAAIPAGPFSLVLVGDADQLPSVGPGQVLRDLIASGALETVRLQRVYRQAEDSGILVAASSIHGGRVPESGEKTGVRDVFLLPREEPERVLQTVRRIVTERLPAMGFDPIEDVQVLTPTRRGPLGTEALNRMLQDALNPDAAGLTRGKQTLRVGDRILCTRNSYDVDVFNGDIGTVRQVADGSLHAVFDRRVVQWSRDDMNLLDLGYAVTVHKSQGSEYPAVLLVLHNAHGIMLRRNLFYTAATRAKRFLCVVGSPRAWSTAVRRTGGDDRYTALADRLRDAED